MTRALVLGVTALALSAGAALAQAPAQDVYPGYGYAPYGYGYVPSVPLYNYAAPPYDYSGPAYDYSGAAYGPAYRQYKRVQTGQPLPKQPQY
jgi:hypothetical protein